MGDATALLQEYDGRLMELVVLLRNTYNHGNSVRIPTSKNSINLRGTCSLLGGMWICGHAYVVV